jgi:hypothetical protein
MADDIGQPPLYLSDEDILETWPNSRVIVIKKNHQSNRMGKAFQTYCPNSKENTKGAIPVVLRYNVWHRLSSKDQDPILGEPITEVHDYDEEEGTLNVRTLQEALETSAQQHVAEALQTVEDEEQPKQTEDESQDEQDPTNIHIQNSPIRTSPTQVFGKNRTMMMMTTQTTTQTTPPSTNPLIPTTTKAQLISTFDRTFK